MTLKEQAYGSIQDLMVRFEEQLPSYKKSDYNETLVHRDFIDPFFKALGWDVDNSQGYAEAYREVIHEDRLKVSGVVLTLNQQLQQTTYRSNGNNYNNALHYR